MLSAEIALSGPRPPGSTRALTNSIVNKLNFINVSLVGLLSESGGCRALNALFPNQKRAAQKLLPHIVGKPTTVDLVPSQRGRLQSYDPETE
ncbi:hypothetical protein EVAR_100009_1 [Eumeta japonica]|uniref:Uncharacterized protein n=1 Tax=Eumeta variegata TaxID=151549 RepID=A0A4C1TKJ7_EUMVA|nr:hypothetical protein EVAR_100009_1 [Eumeta japonica]